MWLYKMDSAVKKYRSAAKVYLKRKSAVVSSHGEVNQCNVL